MTRIFLANVNFLDVLARSSRNSALGGLIPYVIILVIPTGYSKPTQEDYRQGGIFNTASSEQPAFYLLSSCQVHTPTHPS